MFQIKSRIWLESLEPNWCH